MIITPNIIKSYWDDSIYYIEQPVYSPSLAMYCYTNKILHDNGIVVTMAGDMGDEVLGGYPKYWKLRKEKFNNWTDFIDKWINRIKRPIKVYNKVDLLKGRPTSHKGKFIISCINNTGIERLLAALGKEAETLTGGKDVLGPNRIRHISHLNDTKLALERAIKEQTSKNYEITADLLRSASNSLGRIVGVVDIEDGLDELFAGFCIGK